MVACTILAAMLAGCAARSGGSETEERGEPLRLVSLHPAFTEALAAEGKLDLLVAVDVTSSYPEAVNTLPKLGHVRNLKAEALLAVSPDVVIAFQQDVDPSLLALLQKVGVRFWLFNKEFSLSQMERVYAALEDSLGLEGMAARIMNPVRDQLSAIEPLDPMPRVLFIYARGAGAMMVAGKGTPAEAVVGLAGGKYAVSEFEQFKPLSPEALIAADPDVFLLFEDGLESLGGINGMLNVPGVAQTRAGKRKAIVTMDGSLMLGFGPRLGIAVQELHKKLGETLE